VKKILFGIFAVLYAIFLIMISGQQSLEVIIVCHVLGVVGAVSAFTGGGEKE